jgi:hypothetical protein
MRAARLSVANYNTTLSSDSLESGTGSSNSLRSTIQPVGLCAYRRIGGGCEIGCLYRYDEYNEENLPCTTRRATTSNCFSGWQWLATNARSAWREDLRR